MGTTSEPMEMGNFTSWTER